DDLDVAVREMLLEGGSDLAQSALGHLRRERLVDSPQAVLVLLEPRLEVGSQDTEKVQLALIEVTKVSSPGHLPQDADPRLPQRRNHPRRLRLPRSPAEPLGPFMDCHPKAPFLSTEAMSARD